MCAEYRRSGFGGLEIDHQLEFSRLLNRQVTGLGTLEDLVHKNSSAAKKVKGVRPIADKAPTFCELSESGCGQSLLKRKIRNQSGVNDHYWILEDQHGIDPCCSDGSKRLLELGGFTYFEKLQRQIQ